MTREIRQLAWFVWRHYPPAKDWGRDLLRSWLGWAGAQGFLGYFVDENDCVIAVGVARPVMEKYDGYDYWTFDHEGPIVFVDLAIAANERLFRGLMALTKRRFGERQFIGFRRRHGDERRIHIYPYRKIADRILNKELIYGR